MTLERVDMELMIDMTVKEELILKYSILKYFNYEHLPERLQVHSKQFCILAYKMAVNGLIPGFKEHAELVVALRKLLESKDAYIRSLV